MKQLPEPPKPPLGRVISEGVGHFCSNCHSTMSRSGFLYMFGKRYCDNDKCPNSKQKKCSYCGLPVGNHYSFNSIFVTPTIYKCRRWWCSLAKKVGILKIYINKL